MKDEMDMKQEMEKLISLQRIDSEIADFDRAIARCEEAILKREEAIRSKEERLTALRAKIERLTEKQQENQKEHDEANLWVKERQNKMLQVQTPREHQALLKEIEEGRRRSKESEERALQFIEQLEQLEAEVGTLENLCKGEEELLGEARQNTTKEVKRLNSAKKNIEAQRADKVAAVQAVHMQRYNKLISKRAGLAVVAVQGNVCLGCHMTLPPQQVNEVMKGDKLILCPTCQRILYYMESEGQEEAVLAE